MANKLAPSIIFIDEIDCFMRTRNVMEQDHVVRVKTEFMTLWDGLLTGKLCLWSPTPALTNTKHSSFLVRFHYYVLPEEISFSKYLLRSIEL